MTKNSYSKPSTKVKRIPVSEPTEDDTHVAHLIDEENGIEIWVRVSSRNDNYIAHTVVWRNYIDDVEKFYTTDRKYPSVIGAIRAAYKREFGLS